MHKNVGGIDRSGRIVIGILAAIAGIAALTGYWGAGTVVGVVAILVGVVLFVTGTSQKCPLYQAVGMDTSEGGL